MKVKEVMGVPAVAVRPETSFADVVAAMRHFKVGAVTVIDADERPIGVVSDDDLLLKETDSGEHTGNIFAGHRRREEYRKAAGATAMEVMTTPAITITSGASIREAAHLMHQHRIKQLPVIDAVTGRTVGTVQQSDLLRVFTRPVEEIDREVTEACGRLHLDRGELIVGIEAGVVTLKGQVALYSQTALLTAAVRGIEGVLDVENALTYRSDDLVDIPPLYL
jgi:CBS domain-containing protein